MVHEKINNIISDHYVHLPEREVKTQGHSQLSSYQCSFLYMPNYEFVCTSTSARLITRNHRTNTQNLTFKTLKLT